MFGAVALAGGVNGLLQARAEKKKAVGANPEVLQESAKNKAPEPKDASNDDDPDPADTPKSDERPKPVDHPNPAHRDTPEPDERPKPVDHPNSDPLTVLVKELDSSDNAVRVHAAQELARMGESAKPAARALCSAATSDSKEVRQAAIEALEKVQPDLAKPVTTLLVDANNSYLAAQQIAEMGDSAAPAIPVVIWNFRHLNGDVVFDIEALAKIGPMDSEAVGAIIDAAASPTDHLGQKLGIEQEPALTELGKLTQNHGSLRREIVTCLVKTITDCEAGLGGKGGPYYYTNSALAAMGSLGEYGSDAKDAIPALKRLKLNANLQIREAAASALEKIDK